MKKLYESREKNKYDIDPSANSEGNNRISSNEKKERFTEVGLPC